MRWFLAALCVALTVGFVYLAAARSQDAQKRFAGIKIVFIMGGAPGQNFSDNVYRGIKDAGRDLGCDIAMRWTEWSEEKILSQLKHAINMEPRPDGICLIGFPAQESFAPLVDEAVRNGIIVTGMNAPAPELYEHYRATGFGWAGQDGHSAGMRLAAKSVLKFGLKEGQRAVVLGAASVTGRGERAKGCLDGLRAAKLTVDYIDLDKERMRTPARWTKEVFAEYLPRHPDLRLIVMDDGLVSDAEKALREAHKKAGEIAVTGFDATPGNLDAIVSGYAGLLLDQQEYLQGYMPVLQVCLTRSVGVTGLYIETTGQFIDRTNVEDYKRIMAGRALRK